MARKAVEKQNPEQLYAVFLNLSNRLDFLVISSSFAPIITNDGFLTFPLEESCGDVRDRAVFKDWLFYREIKNEDIDGLHEWIDSLKD